MALNEDNQMVLAFMADDVETDPVSGNEVPPGSLPEEVRDDIPAMLSEGEYVVPADVLRFYGMKFFEDLRAEAKRGLAQMEAEGRIGGEPISEPDEELPFSDEELLTTEDREEETEEQMMASMGGSVGYQGGGFQPGVPAWMSRLQNISPGAEGATQFKIFVNDRGQEVSLLVDANNQPVFSVPSGYRLKSEPAPGDITPIEETVVPKDNNDGPIPKREATARALDLAKERREESKVNYSDPIEVEKAVDTYYSSGPALGILGFVGDKFKKNSLIKGIDEKLDDNVFTSANPEKAKMLSTQKEYLVDKSTYTRKNESKLEKGFWASLFGIDSDIKQSNLESYKEKYNNDSANALVDLKEAGKLVDSLHPKDDPFAYHAAIKAQSDASRAFTALKRAETAKKKAEQGDNYKPSVAPPPTNKYSKTVQDKEEE